MTDIVSISSYALPGAAGGRQVNGPDEDALTMAVAAGRAADGEGPDGMPACAKAAASAAPLPAESDRISLASEREKTSVIVAVAKPSMEMG